MKQTKVYMMCGLPGAGKSTYVKEHYPNLPVVSRDIARAALGFTKSADEKVILDRGCEDRVTDYVNMQCASYLLHNQEFVVDNIHIRHSDRIAFIQFLRKLGAKVTLIFIDTPFKICAERRKNDMSIERMNRCREIFQVKPTADEADEFIHVMY